MSQEQDRPGCLIAGVDTLELGFCVKEYLLVEEKWKDLAAAKEGSRSSDFDDKLESIELCGHEFLVNRGGAQRYRYVLRNDDVTLKINENAQSGRYFPETQVVLHSGYLWRNGYQRAIENIRRWMEGLGNIEMVKVTRADLTADVNVFLPDISADFREIVTRAKNKAYFGKGQFEVERHYTGIRPSGYRFGSSNLMCRIYDKVAESYKSRKTWFEELWAREGWQRGDPVTRVEFQLRRHFLRQMQTDSPNDLIAQAPDLWRYLTEEWLTMRVPGEDSHRNRWALQGVWEVVQGAREKFGGVTGVIRMRQMRPTFNKLKNQYRGLAVSIVALAEASFGGKSTGLPQGQLISMTKQMLKDPQFDIDVRRRRAKYSGIYH